MAPTICARCTKVVYFNEEKKAIGKSYHNSCFVCANSTCKRRLDSGSLTEHNDEIFCRPCYSRLFGPKGYGYGGGQGTLSMFNGEESSAPSTPSTSSPSPTFASNGSSSGLNGTSGTQSPTNKENGRNFVVPQKNSIAPKSKIVFGSRDICARCNKAVYMAERMMGGGSAWHKSCFNCVECHKRLESTTLCEREGELYCKACYARLYGPKYYGHGHVAAPIENTMN